ncbi:MAG: PadR family transcriptional regulator [Dehalococcoidia bacterium]
MSRRPGRPSEAGFQVLMTLSEGERHGYAIMRELAVGGVRMGPGTLYGAVKRLIEQHWIEEVATGDSDPRRRTYRLTDSGRAVLRSEAERLALMVDYATRTGALPSKDGGVSA